MRYRITAPVEGVNETVGGVALVNSVGETSSEVALAYFRRHGYQVEPVDEPEPAVEAGEEPKRAKKSK
jgi:hypothetical protein